MQEKNVCHDCKHFGLTEIQGEKIQSVCRRYPLTVHTMMTFSRIDPGQSVMNVMNLFPLIPPDGLGCGEFCRKE